MKVLKLMGSALALATLINFTAYSQTNSLPTSSAEDGRCYAEVAKAAQYRLVPKKILVKEAQQKITYLPAEYDTVTIGVMAHAETKEILVNLYDFEVVEETIEFSSDIALIDIRKEFEAKDNIKESIARNWNLSNLGMCDSPSNDCDLLDWIELPARYIPSQKFEGKAQEDNQMSTSIAILNIQLKEYNNMVIPVEYRFYTKIIETKPVQKNIEEIPALFDVVLERKAVNDEVETEWVEILCPSKLDGFVIGQVQLALKGRKLYFGRVHGYWTEYVQTALENYQIKNNLPIGKLDKVTLEALGLNYEMLASAPDEDMQVFGASK